MYTELDQENSLAEFREPYPSVPLFTDIHTQDGVRTAATVCECGYLKLTMVDESKDELLKAWTRSFDGPLTCVMIMKPNLYRDSLFPTFLGDKIKFPVRETNRSLSMVVTYSLGESRIFSDILTDGLENCQSLESSDLYDCVTSAWAADLTFDGNLTILLGTFGQELLAYRRDGAGWNLQWRRSFPAPIVGVRYADLTGDGVKEVIVITTSGVQILQHDLENVKETALKRLNMISKLVNT